MLLTKFIRFILGSAIVYCKPYNRSRVHYACVVTAGACGLARILQTTRLPLPCILIMHWPDSITGAPVQDRNSDCQQLSNGVRMPLQLQQQTAGVSSCCRSCIVVHYRVLFDSGTSVMLAPTVLFQGICNTARLRYFWR